MADLRPMLGTASILVGAVLLTFPVGFVRGGVLGNPGSAASAVSVAVRGGQHSSTFGREVFVVLEAVLGLDRLFASPPMTSVGEPPRLGAESDSAGSIPEPRPSNPQTAAPASHPVVRLGEAERSVFSELTRRAIQRALGLQGDAAARDRLASMTRRSKSSAALPELRLRAARSTDESLRLTPTVDDPARYTQAGGADLWLEARALWRLDRLVFATEELAVERLRSVHLAEGERLVGRVLDALFAWQRARLKLARLDLAPEEAIELELKVFEAEARLDVLTGGWFGQNSREPARAVSAGLPGAQRVEPAQDEGGDPSPAR